MAAWVGKTPALEAELYQDGNRMMKVSLRKQPGSEMPKIVGFLATAGRVRRYSLNDTAELKHFVDKKAEQFSFYSPLKLNILDSASRPGFTLRSRLQQ